ncbi:response regulator transcription factor [Pseudonocardia sp. T1-2H]|uniref:response regulator transcription factor n=1 Tax=Pseudonocardia sp. T1-2H TaxID=3128899 RepID=UPI003100A9C5
MTPMTAGRTVAPHDTATVLIVDDHQVFAELLGEVLASRGLRLVGIRRTLADGLTAVESERPDLVVLDHSLPGATGASGLRALKQRSPSTRVLMLTAAEERAVLLEAMDAGCDGFVTKRQDIGAVMAAVTAVLRGETPVSPDMIGALVGNRPTPLGGDLTRRESDVLQLIGAGRSNQEVARELRISVNTVRNHVQHILSKLGAHSKLEAVAIAARLGLLRSNRDGVVRPL